MRLPKHSWERDRERGEGDPERNAIPKGFIHITAEFVLLLVRTREDGGGGWASVSQVARKSSRLHCFISFSP